MDRPPMPRAFDIAYQGTPSWETGRPQPAVERLLAGGAMTGRVLDAGCGTGIHAIRLAERGHAVWGIDAAAGAIRQARARAAAVPVTFVHGDALRLSELAIALGGPFDTVLDVGLFHVLQPPDREPYARALAAVVRSGGRALVLAWSDRNPFGRGPARIRRRDLRAAFRAAAGWRVEGIEAETLETRLDPGWVHAWLACARRR